jgi:hypothetical protein
MQIQTQLLLRAFELAGSRRFADAKEIRGQLRAEGFSETCLASVYDAFSTRHALAQILKNEMRKPPFAWITK